jgi:hypothetical protein
MTIDTLRPALQRQPFDPFRVIMSSGQTYDVRHPDGAMLTKNALVVAFGGDDDELPEHVANLSLLHITVVEPLGKRNGSRRKPAR